MGNGIRTCSVVYKRYSTWGEDITETDLLHEEKDKGFSPKKNPQKLMKEMDQIVQDDIKNIH